MYPLKIDSERKPMNGYFPKETVDAVLAVAPQFPVSVVHGRYRVRPRNGEYSYELTIHTDLLDLGEFWRAVEAHKAELTPAPTDTE